MALIYHLDAGNPASYSGSGSTWTDLTGSGDNATLFNAPTWNAKGYFQFNGSNQYGTFAATGMPSGTQPRTISVWLKTTGLDGSAHWAFAYGGYSNGLLQCLGFYQNKYYYAGYAADVQSTVTATDAAWVNLVGTYDGTTAKMYANGVLVASGVLSWNTTATNGNIARQVNGAEYLNAQIAVIQVHDTALTDAQVASYYNATKNEIRFAGNPNPVFHVDAADPLSYSGSGTTWADLSGNGYNVTLVGSPTWNPSGWFEFDGTGTQRGDFSAYTTLLPNGKDTITVMAWVYATNFGQNVFLELGTYANSQSRNLIVWSDGRFYADAVNDNISAPGATNGRWYLMANVYDGYYARLYVNGSLVAGPTAKPSWNLGTSVAYIGTNANNGLPLNGRVAEVRIYDRAVPESEQTSLYEARQAQYNPVSSVNPVASFDAGNPGSYPGSGTTWYDLSGNGYHATLVSSPTWNSDIGSFEFNGTTQYATFPASGLTYGGNPRSLEIWMLRRSNDAHGDGVEYGTRTSSNAYAIGLYNYSSNRIYGYSYANDLYVDNAWVTSKWYQVVFTYDNAVAKLYRNGVEIARGTFAFNTLLNAESLAYIGYNSVLNRNTAQILYGSVGIVRVYNRVITSSEVATSYSTSVERFSTIDSNVSLLDVTAYSTSIDRISPDMLSAARLIGGGWPDPTPVVPNHAGVPTVL